MTYRIIINAYPRRSSHGNATTLMRSMSRTETDWNLLYWRNAPEPRWSELTVVLNSFTDERGQKATNHRSIRKNARGVWLTWTNLYDERPCNRKYKLLALQEEYRT